MKTTSKTQEWMAWEWPGFSWYQGMAPLKAWLYDFTKYGCELKHLAATYSKGTEAYYFVRDEYTKAGATFFTKVKNNPEILFKILKEIDQASEKIFKLENSFKSLNIHKLSNTQLLARHAELFTWDEVLWRKGQIPNILELSNSYLTDYVKKIIAGKFKRYQLNTIFTILTTSRYSSKTEQQDKTLLQLLKQKNSTTIKTLLKKHAENYSWMTYGWAGPVLSEEYFLQNFQEAAKNKKILKEIENTLANKQEVLQKQLEVLEKFTDNEKIFLTLLRNILELKAKRVDAHSLTYFIADKLMIEIGKRTGLSLNQMRVVPPKEVPKLFSRPNIHVINKTYNRVLIWFKRPHLRKLTGEPANKQLAYILHRLPKVKPTNKLRGEFAYPGKVKGRIKIILDIKDAHSFNKGEILVTRMTDPNYVPIMKASKAIITEIGGITCHAAIVSRELRKPCLVGVQNATKILKDGDLVEVDANKGIVRKI